MTPSDSDMTMPPTHAQIPLTLIVAATDRLGIGKGGKLPWRLQSEMRYFKRVTTRPPPWISSDSITQNVVIMGRKTWDSIPAPKSNPTKFRPLENRTNIVISRSGKLAGHEEVEKAGKKVFVAESLEEAVQMLLPSHSSKATGQSPSLSEGIPPIGEVFIIGGSSVYAEALRSCQTKRVLLTMIHRDFECDTFFPVDLEGEQGLKEGWARSSRGELQQYFGKEAMAEFLGEISSMEGVEVLDSMVKEKDVEFEFQLYEKH